jgi:hypothetical protein
VPHTGVSRDFTLWCWLRQRQESAWVLDKANQRFVSDCQQYLAFSS